MNPRRGALPLTRVSACVTRGPLTRVSACVTRGPLTRVSARVTRGPLTRVSACVTRGPLIAHRHSFAPPRRGTLQEQDLCAPLSVSLDLSTLCSMVWDWLYLSAKPMPYCRPNMLFLFVSSFLSFFLSWVGCVWLRSY